MMQIWFLVFVSKLAFTLAVFDLNKIIPELEESDLITWKISEEFFQKAVIKTVCETPDNIIFESKNAYIVLKQVRESESTTQYTIYYLLSGHLPKFMRFKTVEYVIELQNVLSTNQEKFKDKISLIRETYNQESEKFKNIFPQISARKNAEIVSPRRLYTVLKINGEIHLQQIPLHFSELKTSQTYIFDYSPVLSIFNVDSGNIDQDVVSAAQKTAVFIELENIHKGIYKKLSLRSCLSWTHENDYCYSTFLEKLEECPGKHDVIKKMLKNDAKTISNISDYRPNLYYPLETGKKYMKHDSSWKYRETFDFMTKACYVFVMQKVKEVFIYIRDFTNINHLKRCLKYGEGFTAESEHLISVFQKAYPSTPFIFIFEKLILDYNFAVTKFESIIKDIATKLP